MKNKLLFVIKMSIVYTIIGLLLQSFFVSFIFALSPVKAQKLDEIIISVNLENKSLERVFSEIENQIDYKFFYVKEDIPLKSETTIKAVNEPLNSVLEELSSQHNLKFKRINNQIVVKSRKVVVEKKGKGAIKGIIYDKESNEPLPWTNVIVIGTATGAAADINGEFSILNIPEGSYKLKASYLGYNSEEIPVTVSANKTVAVEFHLSLKVVEGKTVVVTAQREGQLAAINEQLQSEQIVNVVSPERIRELPDANAAESVGRLPGVSLTRDAGEGNGIIIRGLSPKYNTIMVNGVALSTSSSEERSTSISGISPETLAGIEVYKAITADMDADNIGGAVNLVMKKAKKKPEYMVRLFGAYNAMAEDFGQYKAFARLSQRVFDNKLGIQASVNGERRNRERDRMRASFYQKTNRADSSIYYEIKNASIENREEIRSRFGGSFILDYGSAQNNYIFSNLFSYGTSSTLSRKHQYDGSQGNIIPSQSESESYSIINTLDGNHQIWNSYIDWNIGHSVSYGTTPFSHSVKFEEKGVGLGEANVKMDPEDFLAALPVDSSASFYESNYYNNTSKERRLSAKINAKIPFNLTSKISSFLKFGGKFTHLTRSNDGMYSYAISTFLSEPKTDLSFWLDHNYDPGKVLNGRTTLGLILNPEQNRVYFDDLMKRKDNYFYGKDNVFAGSNSDYSVTENVAAGYLMFQFKYSNLVTFTPGIRYESESNTYNGHYRIKTMTSPPFGGIYRDTSATRNNGYWFPMIHLKVQPLDWFDLRMSYTKTISRPSYIMLIPSKTVSSTRKDAYVSIGKTSLAPALSDNYDINFAFHGRAGYFSVGLFYKDIVDISYYITPEIRDSADAQSYDLHPEDDYIGRWVSTRTNTPKPTMVKGIEFDIQPNLTLLPGFLSGIVLHANFTIIESTSWLTKRILHQDFSTWPIKKTWEIGFREGPMPDQADYTANLSLGYDIGGFSARFSMFKQGKSLSSVGSYEAEDVYVDDFTKFDFSMKMDISESFTLYLTGQNIANEPDTRRQANTTKYRSVEYYGAMYDFGFQYKF